MLGLPPVPGLTWDPAFLGFCEEGSGAPGQARGGEGAR